MTQVPAREDCVLPLLLERRAGEQPDRDFAVFEDGTEWTYAQTLAHARASAGALAARGVRAGDTVLSWQPNGPSALRTWLAINLLGAVYVPINTAYRGALLDHVIDNSGARVMVAHPQLRERLSADLDVLDPSELDGEPYDGRCPSQSWDPYAIIYTSGTTGPSKGVLSSYAHLWATSVSATEGILDETDRYMINLPLFHGGGTIGVAGALILGGSVSVVEGFQTDRFWDVVRDTGTTAVTLLGVMAAFLNRQPSDARDSDHPLRSVFMIPLSEDPAAFAERFGVGVYTLYNMTETSCPIRAEESPPPIGVCGRPRAGVEVRIVDEHDREVAAGESGELVVRTDMPWSMMHGYHRMPAATVAAWRNGWLHTGDGFRQDADGNYVFVDRIKDAIRRRAENISSFEVEAAVLTHPGVLEAAAVAAASEYAEDEVLVVVAPVPGTMLDPADLHAHCFDAMPHFMVPRYIRVLDALPKTPTSKVEKHVLRAQGVTSDTWDREAHGITVKRERLTP